MATIGRSAKLYQERRESGIRSTLRGPGPQVYLPDNAVHRLDIEAPLPLPSLVEDGCQPGDTKTQVWPHGDKYAP
jgi:hypothetical protein